MEKTKVFNVIVLDKSGSMVSIRQAAIDGVNETISGIKVSQTEFEQTQQHYILLNAFCSHGIDTIYNNVSINEAKTMTTEDYEPSCCTPLYDAMGFTLTKLEERIKEIADCMVSVTVITDGYENASSQFSGQDIKKLIDCLKEKGWTFTYMGADHDVEKVAGELSFDRHIRFEHNEQSTRDVFEARKMDWQSEALAMQELRIMEKQQMRRFSDEERKKYRLKRVEEELQKRQAMYNANKQERKKAAQKDNSVKENQNTAAVKSNVTKQEPVKKK